MDPHYVFIHGLGDSDAVWNVVKKHLTENSKTSCIAVPGHAESDLLEAPNMLSVLQTTLDRFDAIDVGDSKPVVVGHSLGALLAIVIAAQRPCKAVVLVDQPLSAEFTPDIKTLLERSSAGETSAVIEDVRRSLGEDLSDHRELLGQNASNISHEYLNAVWMGGDSDSIQITTGLMAQITAPTYALHCEDLGQDYKNWVEALSPNLSYSVWDHAKHHWFFVDDGERFANFLESVV